MNLTPVWASSCFSRGELPARSHAATRGCSSTHNTCPATCPAPWRASFLIPRSTSSAADSSDKTTPNPRQVGHVVVMTSRRPSVMFCLVISTSPSGEISTT